MKAREILEILVAQGFHFVPHEMHEELLAASCRTPFYAFCKCSPAVYSLAHVTHQALKLIEQFADVGAEHFTLYEEPLATHQIAGATIIKFTAF
jgi:hypothetical protein